MSLTPARWEIADSLRGGRFDACGDAARRHLPLRPLRTPAAQAAPNGRRSSAETARQRDPNRVERRYSDSARPDEGGPSTRGRQEGEGPRGDEGPKRKATGPRRRKEEGAEDAGASRGGREGRERRRRGDGEE